METIKSWYHRIDVQVDRLIHQYKRKKFLLKAKVFLLFVLPVLILLIGVKAAKTWMRIKLLTALIHNFYKTIISKLDTKAFGLKETSRIKAFVFSFISVPAKWHDNQRL